MLRGSQLAYNSYWNDVTVVLKKKCAWTSQTKWMQISQSVCNLPLSLFRSLSPKQEQFVSVIDSHFVSVRLFAGWVVATCPTCKHSAAEPVASVPAPAAHHAAELQQSKTLRGSPGELPCVTHQYNRHKVVKYYFKWTMWTLSWFLHLNRFIMNPS